MRIFAVGDVHGEYFKLERLMLILEQRYKLDLSKDDKIVFMGDLIDRGLYSLLVLDYVYNLQKSHKNNVIVLYANHEDLMVNWHEGRDKILWLLNGGDKTLENFEKLSGKPKCPKKLLQWVKQLPLFHIEPGFFFSHAPIPCSAIPNTLTGEFDKNDYIWSFGGDTPEDEHARNFGDGIVGVCGHIHALRRGVFHPRLYPHYIFTDAGCGCHSGAPLCAVEVVSREVIYSV